MRKNLVLFLFLCVSAEALSLDAANGLSLRGGDSLFALTQSVLSACPGATGTTYMGSGSDAAETAMLSGTQTIAPMQRALGPAACVATTAHQSHGVAVAVDALSIVMSQTAHGVVCDPASSNADCHHGPGYAGGLASNTTLVDASLPGGSYTLTDWREVLLLVYFGVHSFTGTKSIASVITDRDCTDPVRRYLVDHYGKLFQNGCAGDPSNCSALKHAFRLDSNAGATDSFRELLGFEVGAGTSGAPFCNQWFPKGKSAFSNAGGDHYYADYPYQAAGTRGQTTLLFGRGKECNVTPSDTCGSPGLVCTAPPQAPSSTFQGTCQPRACTQASDCGSGVGVSALGCTAGFCEPAALAGAGTLPSPWIDIYEDSDPVRRACDGDNGSGAAGPTEQVCSWRGDLGLVLPISVSETLTVAAAYPSTPCAPGNFRNGAGITLAGPDAQGQSVCALCPNGELPLGTTWNAAIQAPTGSTTCSCRIPVSASNDARCLNDKTNFPTPTSATLPPLGNAGVDRALRTSGSNTRFPASLRDGRVYNLHLRSNASGSYAKQPYIQGASSQLYSVVGAFYRIHSTRTLLTGGTCSGSGSCCQESDEARQVSCLAQASPCSIGLVEHEAPDTVNLAAIDGTQTGLAVSVGGATPIMACLTDKSYPLSRFLYLNSVRGFGVLPSTGDQELELARCFVGQGTGASTLNTVAAQNTLVRSSGFIPITPQCADFHEESCGTPILPASNACAGNVFGLGGVNEYFDSDNDGLADQWEIQFAGNLTTLTGRSQDSDGDGLSNENEYANGTNPLVADTDQDDMPDGWESSHGLSPLVANAYDDSDGDRYPNVFEYKYSTDPSNPASTPTPSYVVNAAGGGTHTTVSAAMNAANVANGAYQIIGIAPGVYTGSANLRGVTISSTKPKLLLIGLQGAAKTIIDGGGANWGWKFQNSAVVASLTFRNTRGALYVESPTKDLRFVDVVVRDNTTTPDEWATPGLHVDSLASGGKVYVVGSTFLNNTGVPSVKQIYVNAGAATLLNTVVWSQTSGTMLAAANGVALTTNNCLVKGQALTGAGNLGAAVDPKLRPDGHLLWDSPLRSAGGIFTLSRIDMDGELRPSTALDIGADQFIDSDSDGLADQWELQYAGNLTTLTLRSQDADGDNLSNDLEYLNLTNPVVSDTDGDGVSDGNEVLVYGSSPLQTDTDADEMPDGWEVNYGLSPVSANALDDDDGDRYPNIFEYAYSTNPGSLASKPTPTFLVNGAGGGTHTTVKAALDAANVANGAYQIIGIAPGEYKGDDNLRGVWVGSTKPKLLLIGLEGPAKTIIDGGGTRWGWRFSNSTVVVSALTFRNTLGALFVEDPSREIRFIDLIVRDNKTTSTEWATPGLQIEPLNSAVKVYIVGSVFLDNTGVPSVKQINISAGTATLLNTVVWSQTSGTMLAKGSGASLITNNCLVKGQTLTGTGNLAGTVDPKLRSDLRIRSDSPLRGAGGAVPHSRIDMDGELRPSTAPDIGVDQFYDPDADGLPDAWEEATTGDAVLITGNGDDDNDQLNNLGEYNWETNWLDRDTDRDGVADGVEVALGTNPLVSDYEDLIGDLNHDTLIDSIGVQLGYAPNQLDSDGDSISNSDEVLMCTNPLRADSDGDGIPDNIDAFPRDPLVSTLPRNSQDSSPPVITLTAPWYAVQQ